MNKEYLFENLKNFQEHSKSIKDFEVFPRKGKTKNKMVEYAHVFAGIDRGLAKFQLVIDGEEALYAQVPENQLDQHCPKICRDIAKEMKARGVSLSAYRFIDATLTGQYDNNSPSSIKADRVERFDSTIAGLLAIQRRGLSALASND